MTSLAKEAETAVKVLFNVCHIGKFMKWLYERENHVIKYDVITELMRKTSSSKSALYQENEK